LGISDLDGWKFGIHEEMTPRCSNDYFWDARCILMYS